MGIFKNAKKEYLLVSLILLSGLVLRFVFVSEGPVYLIKKWIMIDDAFYSLNIAKNVALGNGITCDGIHPTNSFQPLYIFLMAIVFFFTKGNLLTPVTIALAITSLFNLFTGLVIYKLVKKFTGIYGALLSLFIWSFSFTVIKHGLNGLETSISVFIISYSAYYYIVKIQWKDDCPLKDYSVFGFLLGITLLARLDAFFFLFAILIDQSIEKFKKNRMSFSDLFKPLVTFSISLLMVSPVLIRSVIQFNTIVPASGKAARFISLYNGVRYYFEPFYGNAIYFPIDSPPVAFYIAHIKGSLRVLKNYAFFIYPFDSIGSLISSATNKINLPYGKSIYTFLIFLLFIILLKIKYSKNASGNNRRTNPLRLTRLNFLLYFSLMMFLNYTFYIFGQWHYLRYYFPLCMVLTIYTGLFFESALKTLTKSKKASSIIAAILIFYFAIFFGYWKTLDNNGLINFYKNPFFNSFYYDTATWISDHLPDNVKIGGFESGIVGYFAERHNIINLDGPQNIEALQALEEHRVMEYIRSEKIDYIFGQGVILKNQVFQASDKPPADGELTLITKAGTPGGENMLIYKINRTKIISESEK